MKYFNSNPFLLNVMTLISGTALSQGILLAATPFLTRLFTPEEFGIFALYVAIVGIISVVAAWKYELAILLPKKEQDAKALLFLSVIITFVTSSITFVLLFLFRNLINTHFENFSLIQWFIPIGVLITGLMQVFTSWGTRKEYYKIISATRVTQSATTAAGQASLKLINICRLGLIWGHLIGNAIALIQLIISSIKKHSLNLKELSSKDVRYNIVRYSNFPKYQSFAVLVNSLSQNLPVILLNLFYQPVIAGFYSLTHRALSMPIRLVAGSVRQVYYQKAAELHSKDADINTIFIKTTINLAKLSVLPYIILTIFAPIVFSFIFGAEWRISGIYAQILMSFFFLMTINPPAVVTIQILELQKYNLVYELLLAIFSFLALFTGYKLYNSHYISIGLYSFVGTIFNAVLIYFIYRKISQLNN
jgi:O-antigen/teichoic acid export membrane protein